MISKILFFFIISLSILSFDSYGQSYGLEFAGHEVVQDKRTGLNLSAGQKLCLKNFQFEFKLSFMPGRKDYFGYIFRIIDQKNRNIDLVYDMRFAENRHFKLVMGDNVTDINFNIDISNLVKKWYKLTFSFDLKEQKLTLLVDGKLYTQKMKLTKGCYNFFFGANTFDGFSIKDVPPMKIRDIIIREEGIDKYNWPLDERSGSTVKEKKDGKDGAVVNPIWIMKKHFDWELINNFTVAGAASIAFNPSKEKLYVVGEDSLSVVDALSNSVSRILYKGEKLEPLPGNQSLFNINTNLLFNLFVDQRLASAFDFSKGTWTQSYKNTGLVSDYIHVNKFYSTMDSSVYLLGGYGQYTYRRSIIKYHIPDDRWSVVNAKGDFTPRYLAALGQVHNGAYILGGYGSTTGEQILKPRNVYDLNFYDVKKQTFKKLFQLTPKSEEFAFANSMVIDEKSGIYYALTFPNSKYKSSLQLIRGHITSPEYQLVGNSIPYDFHDVHSFADLFYSPTGKKYIAATLLYNPVTKKTTVKVYSLLGPPELLNVATATPDKNTLIILLIVGLLIVIVIKLVGQYIMPGKKGVTAPKTSHAVVTENLEKTAPTTIIVNESAVNAIFLFGNLQLYDKAGEDVTKFFSPLMRELFLLILVYTLTKRKGISSEKLNDILWFDKSVESARNNRSVNIAKLRAVIEKMNGCRISNESGNWMINFDNDLVTVDFIRYSQIMKNRRGFDAQGIKELLSILNRGNFLANVYYDWLEPYKSEISNEIVDTFLYHANSANLDHDPSMLIKLADQVLFLDRMNEEAIAIKCKAWVKMGKHTLATSIFDNFRKEYKLLYGEDYATTFREIVAEE